MRNKFRTVQLFLLAVSLLTLYSCNQPGQKEDPKAPEVKSDSAVAVKEISGPAPGPMTKSYVQMIGRMAYTWGWPLVYVYNQRTTLTKVPEAILLNGAVCVSPMNQLCMLTG